MKIAFKFLTLSVALFTLQSCALFSAAGISSQGQPVKKVTPQKLVDTPIEAARLDHSQWDALLKKYVAEDGMVNYEGFMKDRAELKEYLNMLSKAAPSKHWSVQELLAYYINVYNAFTVDLIVENYPVASIKDINGPWTRGIVPIGKNNLSLGGIENGILRKMDEPRIHFAINCASISCPKLLNEAYTAERINSQLDQVTRDFINGDKNQITAESVQLSSIFDWYKKDYTINGAQDVIGFINQYSDVKINKDAIVGYLEYNWNLNKQ